MSLFGSKRVASRMSTRRSRTGDGRCAARRRFLAGLFGLGAAALLLSRRAALGRIPANGHTPAHGGVFTGISHVGPIARSVDDQAPAALNNCCASDKEVKNTSLKRRFPPSLPDLSELRHSRFSRGFMDMVSHYIATGSVGQSIANL